FRSPRRPPSRRCTTRCSSWARTLALPVFRSGLGAGVRARRDAMWRVRHIGALRSVVAPLQRIAGWNRPHVGGAVLPTRCVARYLRWAWDIPCLGPGVRVERISAEFRSLASSFGFWSALRAFAIRAIQRVIAFKVLRAMCITVVAPGFLELPAGMSADFLDRETLRRMT